MEISTKVDISYQAAASDDHPLLALAHWHYPSVYKTADSAVYAVQANDVMGKLMHSDMYSVRE